MSEGVGRGGASGCVDVRGSTLSVSDAVKSPLLDVTGFLSHLYSPPSLPACPLTPSVYPLPPSLSRLMKIKEWIDSHDSQATVIPFSGALELRVSVYTCVCMRGSK